MMPINQIHKLIFNCFKTVSLVYLTLISKKTKHIVFATLLFASVFVGKSHAVAEDLYTAINPANLLNVSEYLKSVGWGSTNFAVSIICDSDKTVHNTIYKENATWQDCANPILQNQSGGSTFDGSVPAGRPGLASIVSIAIADQIMDPSVPNDMAFFIDDVVGDTIFGTRSYAQIDNLSKSDDVFFKATTFLAWQSARNIALALIGVLLSIGAFGIMFRQKLSPQVMITVSTILPYLPFALIGIVLSYPIVTVFINLQGAMTEIMWGLGDAIKSELIKGIDLGGTISGTAGAALPFIVAMIIGGFFAGGAVIAPVLIFAVILLSGLVLYGFIRFLYEFAKTYISWIMLTLFFPIGAAVSVLPGKQGLISFMFKKLLVNTLVVPLIALFFLIGSGIMLTMFIGTPDMGSGWSVLAIPDVLSAYVKFIIGYGIFNFGLGARGFLEGAFGVKGSLLDAIKPAEKR